MRIVLFFYNLKEEHENLSYHLTCISQPCPRGLLVSILENDKTVVDEVDILKLSLNGFVEDLTPVVRKMDRAIHWINHYPLDSAIGFPNTYPIDSLSIF